MDITELRSASFGNAAEIDAITENGSVIPIASASIASFFIYTDALNILVFLILYCIAFIWSSLINVGIILVKIR
jgi:hypothetical protein